jgi:hypothetical protein
MIKHVFDRLVHFFNVWRLKYLDDAIPHLIFPHNSCIITHSNPPPIDDVICMFYYASARRSTVSGRVAVKSRIWGKSRPKYSVPFSPFQSLSVPFSPFQSLSVPFSPFQSLSVPFSPFQSLSVPFSPFQSLSVSFSQSSQ